MMWQQQRRWQDRISTAFFFGKELLGAHLSLAKLECPLISANLQQLCGAPFIGCKSSNFLNNFSDKSDTLALPLQKLNFLRSLSLILARRADVTKLSTNV